MVYFLIVLGVLAFFWGIKALYSKGITESSLSLIEPLVNEVYSLLAKKIENLDLQDEFQIELITGELLHDWWEIRIVNGPGTIEPAKLIRVCLREFDSKISWIIHSKGDVDTLKISSQSVDSDANAVLKVSSMADQAIEQWLAP